MASKDWVTVKVAGEYEAIFPLIDTLKADSFRYRDLARQGGHRSWDRSYRVGGLTDGFLVESPWMICARESVLSGVNVNIYDGMDRCFMSCIVRDGELVVFTGSAYKRFGLEQMMEVVRSKDMSDKSNDAN